LVYKLAILTGCRRGEIEALTVGHLDLDPAVLRLRPQDTKNGEPAELPLRSDLVDDLRDWLESKRREANREAIAMKTSDRLPPELPLFNVPKQYVKTLDRDLAAAEIPKRDERGRTIDFHALRHTFGTLLSVGGVTPRTAQQAMRHSEIGLTMTVYTDPKLLDVAGAVELLPTLPLDAEPQAATPTKQKATGTGPTESFVAGTVAGTGDFLCHSVTNTGNLGNLERVAENDRKPEKTKEKQGFSLIGVTGFEPAASTSRT